LFAFRRPEVPAGHALCTDSCNAIAGPARRPETEQQRERKPAFEEKLKHPFNHQLYAYWTERRGERAAPERADIDPGAIRRILGDSFVLSREAGEDRFRVAGTRLCALFGRELRGEPFSSIWNAESAPRICDIVAILADEGLGVVAGACARTCEELDCSFEILLLPLMHRGRPGARMLGLLAPLTRPFWLGMWPAQELSLGAIKYIGPDADPLSAARLRAPHRALKVIDGGRP
jgi:hypothetical protein